MTSDTKQCPHCAKTITAAATICRHCGEKLEEPKPRISKLMRWILAGAGALLFVCCGLAGIGSLLDTDTKPAEPAVNQLSAATVEPTDEEPEPTEDATQGPTDTPQPTATETATSTPVPSGELASTTNQYRGPGENYGTAGRIGAGTTIEILSISPDGQWAEVLNRDSVSWVPLSALSNIVNMEAVPLALDIPPSPTTVPTNTPRPTSTPAPTNTPRPTSPPAATSTQAPPTLVPSPVATQVPTEPPAPAEADINIIAVNKQDEYVDIRNDGGQAQDLGGWNLVSERGNQQCPLGGVIQPGQVLRIWALAEDSGQGGWNCGYNSNIWNNSDPDPAVLYNDQGQEVDRYP